MNRVTVLDVLKDFWSCFPKPWLRLRQWWCRRRCFVVYVYPANSVVGGPIEYRWVKKVLEHKVLYVREDEYGYIGCKKDGVFFTREQAKLAREHDTRRSLHDVA